MQLVEYKNKVYSVLIRKDGNNIVASIAVEGAFGIGKDENEAVSNLKLKLNEITKVSNIGKEKLLFG